MLRRFLETAAALGPNKIARSQALRGEAKAIDKVMMGPPPSNIHPGSPAGLRAAARIHLEEQGDGFGRYIRKTHPVYTEMMLEQVTGGMRRSVPMADYRNYRRKEFDLDQQMAEYL